jgi:hypothetical protein
MPPRYGSSSVHSISGRDVASRTKNSAVLLANPPGVIRSGELLSAESQHELPLPFAVQMDLTLVTKEATS